MSGDPQPGRYDYDHDGQRDQDDRHARKARDLMRAGIYDEASREAQKVEHFERSTDLIDEIHRERRRDDAAR